MYFTHISNTTIMNKILVPTDFSECANNAANIAMEIAKKLDAEIEFMHYTEIPVDWVKLDTGDDNKMYSDVDKRIKQCQDQLNEWVRKSEQAGIKATSYLAYNQGYQNVIERIENQDIDLVVMGTHGASGLKGLFLGSNTQKVIRLSEVPVIAIKGDAKHMNMDRMTLAFDFPVDGNGTPESYSINGLFKEMALAKALGMKLDFLFVNTPGHFISSKQMKARMNSYAQKLDIKAHDQIILNAFNLVDGIIDYQEQKGNTLVGMLTHGDRGFNRLVQSSHVEQVANRLEGMLLSTKMDV